MNLQGYRCPNCTSMIPIDSEINGVFTCPHCQSQFEREYDSFGKPQFFKIQVCQAKIKTLRVDAAVDLDFSEHLDEEGREYFTKQMVKEMSHKLADSLIPFMKISTRQDPYMRTTVFGAELNIAEPIDNGKDAFGERIENYRY